MNSRSKNFFKIKPKSHSVIIKILPFYSNTKHETFFIKQSAFLKKRRL